MSSTINKKSSIVNKGVLIILGIILLSQFNVKAQAVNAYFYYSTFYTPSSGTYIETYIAFSSSSLHYKLNADNALDASVEVTMIFKNIDEIKEYRKFNVVSPSLPDSTTVFFDFIDLQRIAIPEGVYNFDLIIKDNNAPDHIADYSHSQLITVNIPKNEMSFSGIELIKRRTEASHHNIFVKNGFEYIPYISNTFPKNINKLSFYTELYNATKEIGPLEDFLFMSHIENSNTLKSIKEFSTFEIQKAYNSNITYKTINIKKLPTGNYYLVIEVRDKQKNILLSTKKFFQRTNMDPVTTNINVENIQINNTFVTQLTNTDSLSSYIKSLTPICDINEKLFIDNQLQSASLKIKQQFFYNFWEKRDENNPGITWIDYKNSASIVEKLFQTQNSHGYNTDRGRVYLQYGSPNSINIVKNDSSLYPYEIWHYYKIADLTNKKFIFYSQSYKENDYKLLHSDMMGEIHNNNWESELNTGSRE